jgi:hypothetical protein
MTAQPLVKAKPSKAKVNGVAVHEDTLKIEQINFEFDKMLEQWIGVNISMHGFSMFRTRVTPEELGIPDNDPVLETINLGVKALLPAEGYLAPFESTQRRTHRLLERYSQEIEGFYPWRFMLGRPVPADAPADIQAVEAARPFGLFMAEFTKIKEQTEAIKEKIIADYDSLYHWREQRSRDDARNAWAALYARVSRRIKLNAPEIKPKAVMAEIAAEYGTEESFVERVVKGVMGKFPSRPTIRENVAIKLYLGRPTNLAAFKLEQLAAQEKALEVRMKNMELAKEERHLAAIKLAELQNAREAVLAMKSPFQEVLDHVGSQIIENCKSIVNTINQHGYLPGRGNERARGIVEMYELFQAGLQGNDKLEEALSKLKAALVPQEFEGKRKKGESYAKYDAASIKAALVEVQQVAQIQVEEVKKSKFSGFTAVEF